MREPICVSSSRFLDEDARARVAALARGVVDRIDGARDRRLEVGIGEEDVRALAAELERDALHGLCAEAHDLRARPRRARERHLVHSRVGDEVGAGRRALARHDVDDAGREPDLHRELGEAKCGQRRGRIRLEDDRAARCKRGRELPRRHHERVVPGDDLRDDADGLLERVGEDGAAHRHCPPGDRGYRGRVPAEILGGDGDLSFDGGDGLADIARLELDELLAVGDDRVGERMDEPRALVRRRLRPRALECAARRLDGPVDILRSGHRGAGERRSGRRLGDVADLAALDRFPSDEEAVVLRRDRHHCPPVRSKIAACP
jgi:hypothetical protein